MVAGEKVAESLLQKSDTSVASGAAASSQKSSHKADELDDSKPTPVFAPTPTPGFRSVAFNPAAGGGDGKAFSKSASPSQAPTTLSV